jgi:hypothetical protein
VAKERGKESLSEIETQRWLPSRVPTISELMLKQLAEIETHAIAFHAPRHRFRNASVLVSRFLVGAVVSTVLKMVRRDYNGAAELDRPSLDTCVRFRYT